MLFHIVADVHSFNALRQIERDMNSAYVNHKEQLRCIHEEQERAREAQEEILRQQELARLEQELGMSFYSVSSPLADFS